MNRLKSSILVVLALLITAGLAAIPALPAQAQGSAALSIPPRKNYTIEPGKSVEDTLLINNLDSERPLYLSLRKVDFTYTNDGGTPKLNLDPQAPNTPWSLKPFLDIPENVTIEAGSSASIDMSVSIPADYKAGSYYSAIIFDSSASEGGNVGLSASGVSLVFVTIPGEVDEKLTLQKLGAYTPNANSIDNQNPDVPAGKYKFFNMDMPLQMGYTLKNEGNVAESPIGSMTLKGLFGKEIVINDINPRGSLALIGQTRTFDVCIKTIKEEVEFDGSRQEAPLCSEDTGLWPGLYSVEMSGFYGWNGNATQEIIGKAWFVYTPIWFIVVLLLVFAFVGYHVWRIVRFIKGKRGGSSARPLRGRK